MSANLYWRPSITAKGEICTWAPSRTIATIERVFRRSLPCCFNARDRDKLEALRDAMHSPDPDDRHPNPWDEILEALDSFEEIEVWAEH
jgi:hypothetical protein